MATTMVVLAAGMGSRFGGPKQLVPVGPAGETILDYNTHDAAAAGFGRVVVVTRTELLDQVEEAVAKGVGRVVDTRISLQEIPAGRSKPLGTAEAVVVAQEHVDGPFAVANSDDLYGPASFQILHDHLVAAPETGAVVGFRLDDTVPAEGAVSRAVLAVDDDNSVRTVMEVHGISRSTDLSGHSADALVSMNMWGFPQVTMADLAGAVDSFVAASGDGEVFLPEEVSKLLASDRLALKALSSTEEWSGMTNPDDIAQVRAHAAARWPSPLWS